MDRLELRMRERCLDENRRRLGLVVQELLEIAHRRHDLGRRCRYEASVARTGPAEPVLVAPELARGLVAPRAPDISTLPDCGVTSVLLALVNAFGGALLGARRHPLGKLRAVFGYPPICAVGEAGKLRETGCREQTGRQQP